MGIVYLTKHDGMGSDSSRQADTEIEVSPEMIEAGLAAYSRLAWHDSRSLGSPREVVEAILVEAFQASP